MSGTPRGPMELSVGCRLVLAGAQWQVQEFEPHTGRVLLRRDDGHELATTVRALVNHGDCRPATATAAGPARRRGRQPAGLRSGGHHAAPAAAGQGRRDDRPGR